MKDYVSRGLWPKRYLDNLKNAGRITLQEYDALCALIPVEND